MDKLGADGKVKQESSRTCEVDGPTTEDQPSVCVSHVAELSQSESGTADAVEEKPANQHESEEWYQKWLRRKEAKTSQVAAGAEKKFEQLPCAQQEEKKVEEPAQASTLADGDPRKAYEHEEWYQKWLRRQENKPRKIIYLGGSSNEASTAPVGDENEKRVDKDSGKVYTLSEFKAEFEKVYSEAQIRDYWRDACTPVSKDDAAQPGKTDATTSHETEAAVDGEHVASKSQAADSTEQDPIATGPDGRKNYEHEEWYQKWLRRQENKARQIVSLGSSEKTQESPSVTPNNVVTGHTAEQAEGEMKEPSTAAVGDLAEQLDRQKELCKKAEKQVVDERRRAEKAEREVQELRVRVRELEQKIGSGSGTGHLLNTTSKGPVDAPPAVAEERWIDQADVGGFSGEIHDRIEPQDVDVNLSWQPSAPTFDVEMARGRTAPDVAREEKSEKDPITGATSVVDEEQRVDSDSGKTFTFSEFKTEFKGVYSEQEILDYWRDACTPVNAKPPEEERHPHENEEWYQKWLRRQKNRPRQIVELGKS